MSHRRAVVLMIVITLMWSSAGVVTRQLESARSFEVTFWRSAFNAAALTMLLAALRGPRALWRSIAQGGPTLWISGLCWSVMYTAFMLALTLTTVANVLVTMATGPLLTAMVARVALGHQPPMRTWAASLVAGIGMALMYAREVGSGDAQNLLGTAVALCVPIASALNWTAIQHNGRTQAPKDMLPAVWIGAVASALISLPWALPFSASRHDLAWLALLGIGQLAVPCLMVVTVVRTLPAAEVALLGLLEVIFGVIWAWLGAGEAPSRTVLAGGTLVLGSLACNALLGARESRRLDRAGKLG